MCIVCGCGSRHAETDPADPADLHEHEDVSGPLPAHHHEHGGGGEGPGPLGAVHSAGTTPTRMIQVEEALLAENDRFAALNRAFLASRSILALNLMSGPGAGKTTLLTRTIADLRSRMPIAVIEGDQQTIFDAERIRAAGAPAFQINTGKGCHLDAHMVGHALRGMTLDRGQLTFIENVGNLVCPAGFDLGEAARVVILSVTDGDDKPLKYPDIFAAADLMVVSKIDLLPHVPFDLQRCIGFARRVRPAMETLALSATTGEGLSAWYDWIDRQRDLRALQPSAESSRRINR